MDTGVHLADALMDGPSLASERARASPGAVEEPTMTELPSLLRFHAADYPKDLSDLKTQSDFIRALRGTCERSMGCFCQSGFGAACIRGYLSSGMIRASGTIT